MTGLNIQSPWASLLIRGVKTVETRSYPLPNKYIREELAIIETPGKYGRFKARIIGTITFDNSFKYPNKQTWLEDYNRHCVEKDDPLYGWVDDDSFFVLESKPKYGWVVNKVIKFDQPLDIHKRKGIVFTTGVKV